MKTYFSLMRKFVSSSLQLELQYRVNLLIHLISATLSVMVGVVVLDAFFFRAEEIGGWRFSQALALFGVYKICEGFIEIILAPNLQRLPEEIRMGNLDYLLLKPVSAQFFVSFRHIGIWKSADMIFGLSILIYSMVGMETFTLAHSLRVLALLACAFAIIYSIWLMLVTTAFWFIKVDNIWILFSTFMSAGRFPVSAYPNWLAIILTVVVPISFITTVPAEAAISLVGWSSIAISAGVATFFLLLSNRVWYLGLRSYTSASS